MNADTFWTNPQYRVTVIDADEGDADNTGSLIIALLQKERRLKRAEGAELLTIGYAVYKVCRRLVRGSILCDPIQPNSTPQLTDPTQYKWENLDPTRPDPIQLTMELTV